MRRRESKPTLAVLSVQQGPVRFNYGLKALTASAIAAAAKEGDRRLWAYTGSVSPDRRWLFHLRPEGEVRLGLRVLKGEASGESQEGGQR